MNMQEDRKNTLTSFQELYKVMKAGKLECESAFIKESSLYDENDVLPGAATTLNEHKYSFIYEKHHSINLPKKRFTNKISTLGSNQENDLIREIIQMVPKCNYVSELPVKFDSELDDHLDHKKITSRHQLIFKESGITYEQSMIWKFSPKHGNNGLRVFMIIDYEKDIGKVVLFDPHHLLATSRTDKYDSVCQYHFDIYDL